MITQGPKHRWFGYYDKLQFDPTDRYVLGMQVDFEHRSPTADDVIQIGMVDPHAEDLAPAESGIHFIDLESGDAELIMSLQQVARMGPIPDEQFGIKHYFKHLLFSPDGSRLIALHRWRYPQGNRLTRMITANTDGSDIRIVIPNGYASH